MLQVDILQAGKVFAPFVQQVTTAPPHQQRPHNVLEVRTARMVQALVLSVMLVTTVYQAPLHQTHVRLELTVQHNHLNALFVRVDITAH